MRPISTYFLIASAAALLVAASGELLTYPTNKEAVAGDSVVFPCSTDLRNSLHWWHTPVGTDYLNDVYFHGKHVKAYWPRFRVQKVEARGEYNLSISSVQPPDAGTYTCIDKAEHGIQREAELVVLGSAPVGQSNTSLDQLTVCGDQAVIVLLTCDVNYTGNIPPELNWKQITKNDIVISHTNTLLEKHSHGVSCSVKFEADPEMDGSVFVCETSSAKYNWQSGSVKLRYASNTTLKEKYISPRMVYCEADSNVICHYTWTQVDSDEKIVSSTGTLDLAHHGHGRYQCTAECDLGGFNCKVYPHLVEYRSDEKFHDDRNDISFWGIKSKVAVGIAVSIIGLTVATIVVIITLRHQRLKKNTPGQAKLRTDPSNAFLLTKKYSSGSFEKFIGQDRKTTLATSSSTTTTSSSALITLKLRDTMSVGDFQARGIVNYNDKFYVVLQSHNTVKVFEDVPPHGAVEDFVIDKMEEPWSLELSQNPLCLYIPDRARKCIWRVRGLNDKLKADEWMHSVGKPFKLSVMRNGNVLIPEWPARTKVFDPSGHEIETIDLRKDMMEPYHAVETSKGLIVVGHGDVESKLHRVCLIKTDGTVLWSYGNEKGSKEDQLHSPHHMVLDEEDRIFISDQANMRIVVLDINGQRLASLETENLIPYRSFYAPNKRSLLVGGYGSIFCYAIDEHDVV